MTEVEFLHYRYDVPTVAYTAVYGGGIEVKEILYGIEDYVVFVAGTWFGTPTVHKVKIHYTKRPYFRFGNIRVHFDELIRYRY